MELRYVSRSEANEVVIGLEVEELVVQDLRVVSPKQCACRYVEPRGKTHTTNSHHSRH